METGQQTYQARNNINKTKNIMLSIQVSLNGLSFCTLNTQNQSITYYSTIVFDKRLTPNLLLERLISQLNSDKNLQKDFDQVIVIHENELSTLVPNKVFNEDHMADYLKFNSKILSTDYITYDAIKTNKCVNVYVPYVNVNNYVYDQFGEFKYLHFSTVLIEKLLNEFQDVSDDSMVVHVSNGHFEIVVIGSNGLRLYNSFEFHTKEDFIYYILFTIEQLQLDPETIEVNLMGDIMKDDDLYKMIYEYIRHISFFPVASKFSVPKEHKDILFNYTLCNSF